MKKIYQKYNYPYGDCFSSCIASIIEDDNVPNFMMDGEDNFEKHFTDWLNKNNYSYFHIKYEGPVYSPPFALDGYCILTGMGKR